MDKYQEEFREILAQISPVYLETKEGWFTWNNRREGDHLVASRLDRFLVSENITMGSGETWTNVLPAAGSDHLPICLNWDSMNAFLPKPFSFEHFLLDHKDFKGLVH